MLCFSPRLSHKHPFSERIHLLFSGYDAYLNEFGAGTQFLGCRTNEEIPLTLDDVLVMAVVAVFVLLVLSGTLIDAGVKHFSAALFPDNAVIMLQGFSLYTTLNKVFHVSTNKDNLGKPQNKVFF